MESTSSATAVGEDASNTSRTSETLTLHVSPEPFTSGTLPYPNTSIQNLEPGPNVNTLRTAPPGHPGTSSVQRPLNQTAFREKCQQLDHDTFTPTVAGDDAKHGCLANTKITSIRKHYDQKWQCCKQNLMLHSAITNFTSKEVRQVTGFEQCFCS